MRACVIFNPAARGDKARQFREQLAALSAHAALRPTTAPGAGRPLAAEAVREGFDTIVAAGGDGTLNEVLNGIVDAPDGLAKARLGVLPLGTINVFARELGLPRDFDGAWRVIQAGHELVIDLPEAEFAGGPQPAHRCFAQLAGAGLDARAIELVDWEQKKLVGPLAYVVAGFKALAEEKPLIVVQAGDVEMRGELILVGNGRYYGGEFKLFPEASLCDGVLDVTVFPRADWETLVRGGWGWLTDAIHSSAGCQTIRARSFTLSSARSVPFELDGDIVGQLPARFSVRPQALRVLVP